MTQLATDTGAAVADVSVEQTETTPAAEQTPDTEQDVVDLLYPADGGEAGTDDQEQPDPEPEGEGEEEAADEDSEPDEPAIAMPHSWKAEEAERWASLPRETQSYLAERETERERFVQSKAREAQQAKETVTRQAETELAQFSEQQAAAYQQLAAQFFPKPPDDRLLYTSNPDDHLTYQQQEAQYRRGLAQQQQLQQAAQEHADRAQRIRDDQAALANQQDTERLREAMPEWFDEAKAPDLQRELTATAKALGYPDELLPEANASDLLALRQASEWKADAQKWRDYQKAKMVPVREAKKKPPIPNKPGAGGASGQVKSLAAQLYPDDVRN